MDKLLVTFNKIECARTKAASLRSIVIMATSYPKIVMNNLLNQPLPYQLVICDCLGALSTDESVVLIFFDHFKKLFKCTTPYAEKHSDTNITSLQPLQVICALNEICKNVQLQSLVKQQFPDVFCRLIIILASYTEVEMPAKDIQCLKPTNLCLKAAKQILTCCGYDEVSKVLPYSGVTELKDVLDIIPKLTKEMCVVASDILPSFVSSLAQFSRSECIPWRSCATKFLASLLEYYIDISLVLAENIIEILLGCQSDSSCMVRQIAFYGLGVALEKLHWDITSRYCDGIVDAFLRTLEYYNGKEELQVVLELTAAVRIKPLFEQESGDLRAASFYFLGDLADSSLRGKNADVFKEHIYGDFVPLLLHLVDENEGVVQGCKYALQRIAPILNSPNISKTIQKNISTNNVNFTELTSEFVAILGEELQELLPVLLQACASYWKTECILIKAHALLLARIIIQATNEESFNEIPMVTLSHRLLNLCEDCDPYVRAQAIKTVSSFFLK
ncbi:maestro heat-like repeat-containing protein family member 1 isoform X2 [Agrilus planipennis]|uniref:Maestro heat-like repeat-containing protein family member 1 isoform X2 n=1 Tax=Agrilus planipennis TaxID=224129 RepID=A0A1W4X1M9_AGRPL|nr:maestro heat-like repeat-containing protein family member 1 isoform X2 [Agrilus planipennis]